MKVLSENMKTTDDWDKTRWKESYDKKVTLLNKQLEIVAVEAFDPNEVFKLNLKFYSQDF